MVVLFTANKGPGLVVSFLNILLPKVFKLFIKFLNNEIFKICFQDTVYNVFTELAFRDKVTK